jgi:hypothetical protein
MRRNLNITIKETAQLSTYILNRAEDGNKGRLINSPSRMCIFTLPPIRNDEMNKKSEES